MLQNKRNLLLIIVGVLVILVIALLLFLRPSAEDLLVQALEAPSELTSAHSVVELSVNRVPEDLEVSVEYWFENDSMIPVPAFRLDLIDSPETERNGSALAFDGETIAVYQADKNQALLLNLEDLEGAGQILQRLLADGQYGAALGKMPKGAQGYLKEMFSSMMPGEIPSPEESSPKDEDWSTPGAEEMVDRLLAAAVAERSGREWVAGQWAYVVEITADPAEIPPDKIDQFGTLTLWIGPRHKMPLGVTYAQGPYTYFNLMAADADFNREIEDETFVLDLPADAKIISMEDIVGRMESFENSKEDKRDKPPRSEDLPGDPKLQKTYERGGITVSVYTMGKGKRFSVMAADSDAKIPGMLSKQRGEEIRVRGNLGYLLEDNNGRGIWIQWQEGDQIYVITGALTAEEAVEFAESLD